MDTRKLFDWIEANRDEMIRETCGLVSIPSVSENAEQVGKALDYVIALAERLGFRGRKVLSGQIGIIEAGEGPETFGILAHVDVVPPGDLAFWQTDPFRPVVKDGAIFGRGTIDDKGPIIACLYAMKAAANLGIPFRKKTMMILGTQEEVEWTDMEAFLKSGLPLPDYGFTPDGEFPVCNIEKGVLDIEVICPKDSAPQGEGVFLRGLSGGTVSNIVPDHAEAILLRRSRQPDGSMKEEEFTVAEKGVSVHSCQPEKGENAIIKLCKTLGTQSLAEGNLTKLAAVLAERFSDLRCGGIGMATEDEYVNGEFVHCNMLAVTHMIDEPEQVRVTINIRTVYGVSDDAFVSAVEEAFAGTPCRIGKVTGLPPVYISRERPFMKAFARAYETATGTKNEFTLAYGGSYAKAMPNIASWGPLFPDEEDTCHEANERITIDGLLLNAKIFAAAIGEIVLSADSYQ